tara:strand:+ start:199 stop:876 length:678 start_codon:yes stop_codon:yes gene_type:complete
MSTKKIKPILKNKHIEDETIIEIGVDEAGRGPMLGRVYSAAVILPKDETFKHELMKDSKKFTSEKKINEVADYIKENAIMWNVAYCSEEEIDHLNIRNATHRAMHNAIRNLINNNNIKQYHLLIDGNDFKSFTIVDNLNIVQIPHTCIKGGDNIYSAIAAASILAKVERDKYIYELCDNNPELDEKYSIRKNKGYGTKDHMNGIIQHGISNYHRKTFGLCRNYNS